MIGAGRVSFRSEARDLLVRGVDTPVRLLPSRGGTALTPSSATVTLLDASGATLVSAATATCADGEAVYTVPGSLTASLPLGDRWTLVWSCLLPGETTARTIRGGAALVRAVPHPVLASADVYRRVRALDPAGAAPMTSLPDLEPFLVDAWSSLVELLDSAELRPWLVIEPHQLREPHLLLTIARVWADEATRNNGVQDTADRALAAFEACWAGLALRYDRDDTGAAANASATPTTPSLWLGGVMP